jgi:hypothetical protein
VAEPSPSGPPRQRFRLSPPPPIRALAVASAASLFGVIVLAFWGLRNRGLLLLVVGLGAMIFGVVLTVVAFVLNARLRMLIYLDADGITLTRGGLGRRSRELPWSDIKEVTLKGPRLTLFGSGDRRLAQVINPRAPGDLVFTSLITAIRQRLDASRGYGVS